MNKEKLNHISKKLNTLKESIFKRNRDLDKIEVVLSGNDNKSIEKAVAKDIRGYLKNQGELGSNEKFEIINILHKHFDEKYPGSWQIRNDEYYGDGKWAIKIDWKPHIQPMSVYVYGGYDKAPVNEDSSDELQAKKSKEKGILDRAEEEYRDGNPGGALRLLDTYLKDNEPFYKYDFERWKKRCLDYLGADAP